MLVNHKIFKAKSFAFSTAFYISLKSLYSKSRYINVLLNADKGRSALNRLLKCYKNFA